ncbi:MAG: hypothetical protein HZA10_09610 [Nitrospirae bacterium]|nr:hypothetical protein [Nitrospirota bacterium]
MKLQTDVQSNYYTIGEKARLNGLDGKGQTVVFNFKPAFGAGGKEFSKDKNYWFHYLLEGIGDSKKECPY